MISNIQVLKQGISVQPKNFHISIVSSKFKKDGNFTTIPKKYAQLHILKLQEEFNHHKRE